MKRRHMMTVPQANREYGIGRDTLRNLCRYRQIPAVRIGNRYYIHRARFERWLAEQADAGRVIA